MVAADINTHNSLRQLSNYNMASSFRLRRIMILAWQCFNDDFIRTRKAELLMPKAKRHYDATFFGRVVKATFGHDRGMGYITVHPFYAGGLKYLAISSIMYFIGIFVFYKARHENGQKLLMNKFEVLMFLVIIVTAISAFVLWYNGTIVLG